MSFSAAVVTVSDRAASGERRDESGDTLERMLLEAGAASVSRAVVPDEREQIASVLRQYCTGNRADIVITTGGTGLAPRDVTPEATRDVIEREAPGFAEAVRMGSLQVTARAMLSRAVSGICASTLIINFPGSPMACRESFDRVRPVLGHAVELLSGARVECAR